MALDNRISQMKEYFFNHMPDYEVNTEYVHPTQQIKPYEGREILVKDKEFSNETTIVLHASPKEAGTIDDVANHLVMNSAENRGVLHVFYKDPKGKDYFSRSGKGKPPWLNDKRYSHFSNEVRNRFRAPTQLERIIPKITKNGIIYYQPDSTRLNETLLKVLWVQGLRETSEAEQQQGRHKFQKDTVYSDPIIFSEFNNFLICYSQGSKEDNLQIAEVMQHAHSSNNYNKILHDWGSPLPRLARLLPLTEKISQVDAPNLKLKLALLNELVNNYPGSKTKIQQKTDYIKSKMVGQGLFSLPVEKALTELLNLTNTPYDENLKLIMTSDSNFSKYPIVARFNVKSYHKSDSSTPHSVLVYLPDKSENSWRVMSSSNLEKLTEFAWTYKPILDFLRSTTSAQKNN